MACEKAVILWLEPCQCPQHIQVQHVWQQHRLDAHVHDALVQRRQLSRGRRHEVPLPRWRLEERAFVVPGRQPQVAVTRVRGLHHTVGLVVAEHGHLHRRNRQSEPVTHHCPRGNRMVLRISNPRTHCKAVQQDHGSPGGGEKQCGHLVHGPIPLRAEANVVLLALDQPLRKSLSSPHGRREGEVEDALNSRLRTDQDVHHAVRELPAEERQLQRRPVGLPPRHDVAVRAHGQQRIPLVFGQKVPDHVLEACRSLSGALRQEVHGILPIPVACLQVCPLLEEQQQRGLLAKPGSVVQRCVKVLPACIRLPECPCVWVRLGPQQQPQLLAPAEARGQVHGLHRNRVALEVVVCDCARVDTVLQEQLQVFRGTLGNDIVQETRLQLPVLVLQQIIIQFAECFHRQVLLDLNFPQQLFARLYTALADRDVARVIEGPCPPGPSWMSSVLSQQRVGGRSILRHAVAA
mmetsp:Transcript_81951/g.232011  ORF Transcript_81951/g.232011 Transcript_81951/m.232011 type:complete len:463 (-) Transcript_81951:7-1395(-)